MLGYLAGERSAMQGTALAVSRALATAVDSELRATVGALQSLALSDELQPQGCANSMPWPAASPRPWAGGRWCWPTARARCCSVPRAHGRGVSQARGPGEHAARDHPAPAGGGHGDDGPPQRRPGLCRAAAGAAPGRAALRPVGRDPRRAHPRGAAAPVRALHLGGDGARPEPEPGGPLPAEPGVAASPSLQALLQSGGAEGVGPTITLEGMRSHTGFSRLQNWGWVVATGISAEDADSGLYGVLGAVGAGLLASLALAAFVAWYFSRDVIEPIETLKGRRQHWAAAKPCGRALGIAELEDVGQALELASANATAPRGSARRCSPACDRGTAARGGRPQQGRVPRHAGARAAQSPRAHGDRAAPDGAQGRRRHAQRARGDGAPSPT